MWNANAKFLNSKQKTKAYKEYPKNIRQMLNIDQIHPNGIFKIEPGNERCMYDRCYVFEDINHINQDDSGKESMLVQFMKWLNSMRTQFKITLANEYRDLDVFLQEVLQEPNKEQYPIMEEGITQWIQNKIEDGSPNIKQVKYLVVTCYSSNFEDAQIYFNMLEEQLERLFLAWKSRIYRLNAKERLRSLHAFFRMGKEEDVEYDANNLAKDWRNNILPVSMEQFSDFLIFDKLYVSVLFGYRFSSSIDEGKFLTGFHDVSFPTFITIDYAPIEVPTLNGKIENAHTNNEKAIADEVERKKKTGNYGSGISYQKIKKKEELEEYQEQINANDEHGFFIGMLLVVTANNENELAQRIEQMQALGKEKGVILETYNHRQLKALNTALPFGGRQVDHMRSFLTSSAIAFQPYYAQDVQETSGGCYGLNRTTKRLIIGNRKKLKNPHGIIVGHTGSGKSMSIKIELCQDLLRTDDDAVLLDPQDEFKEFVQKAGGTFYELVPGNNTYLNPYEVSEDVFHGDQALQIGFIATQSKYTKAFLGAIMTNIVLTQEHYVLIDRCIRNMYTAIFSQKKLKKQATLTMFRNEYLQKEKETVTDEVEAAYIRQIYNSLEEYTQGSYDLFARESNIDIHHRLVAFGLKKVASEHWEPAIITIMHFLATRMEYNQRLQKATRLVVDETQVVCQNPTSAEILLKSVVTFRKFGGICTLAFQNLSRILGNEDLRDMFSNCEYKCFLDQGGVDAHELAEIQELSTREFQELSSEHPGHGVMVWGKKVILFDAFMEAENPLYEILSTDYHEKAEKYKQTKRETEKELQEEQTLNTVVDAPKEKNLQESESVNTNTHMKENAHTKENTHVKEKIATMIAFTPVSLEEIGTMLQMNEQRIKEILKELQEEKRIRETLTAGGIQYTKVG